MAALGMTRLLLTAGCSDVSGRSVRPVLPEKLRTKVPPRRQASLAPPVTAVVLARLVVLSRRLPNTNAAAARVLDKLGITMVEAGGRLLWRGELSFSEHERGLEQMRRNIDAWWPAIEAGAEAIIVTASGCGAMVSYGHLLRDDPVYANKARKVSELCTIWGFPRKRTLNPEGKCPCR